MMLMKPASHGRAIIRGLMVPTLPWKLRGAGSELPSWKNNQRVVSCGVCKLLAFARSCGFSGWPEAES